MQKNIITIILCVVFLGGGFYAGTRYAQASATPTAGGNSGQFTQGGAAGGQRFGGQGNGSGRQGGARGGNFTVGEVLKKDATSITVKLTDGGSKIIYVAPQTTVSKSATGTIDDVAVGTNVMVNGTANPDGSLTAQMVQIRPNLPPRASGNPSSPTGTNPAASTAPVQQ